MHMDAYRTIIDIFSYQVGRREKLYDIVSLIMFYPSCKLGFGVSTRLPKCFQEQKLMILPFSIQENWDMSYGRWLPPSQNADRQIWRETEMAVRLTGLLVCIPSFWFDTIFQNPMFECVWCLKSMRILCLLLFFPWSKLSCEMFWEIIGASLGAARRRHPRPCLGISWHCLEGRERTAGGLLGIYMVPEMDDWNMKQRVYKVYIFKITSLIASCCHGCIGTHDCHGCHGRTQDTCYILLHCCCELRTRMTPRRPMMPRRPMTTKMRQGSKSTDGCGWLT